MKKFASAALLAALLLLILFTAVSAHASPALLTAGWKPSDDEEIITRLTLINPEAVEPFKEGSAALYESDNYELARQKFALVLKLAPEFPDALRRLGHAYKGLNNTDEALSYYYKALRVEKSAENKNALASGLLLLNTPEANEEASSLIREVINEKPDDLDFNVTAVYVGLAQNNPEYAAERANFMLAKYPDDYLSHYLAALVAINKSDAMEADRQIQTAKKLGAPDELVNYLNSIPEFNNQLFIQRAIIGGSIAFAGWIVLLVVLFLAGISLSQLTIRTIKTQAQSGISEVSPVEKAFRRIYGFVVGMASVYFYLSIPIMILVVVLSVVGLGYLFLQFGRIPANLAIFILVVSFYTLTAIVRSLFIRPPKGDPGRSLTQDEAPEFWILLTDVAGRLSTRPVEKVFVIPEPSIGVFERGNWLKKMNNKGERCLILGLGALNEMTQGEFQAVLAHEYGHFIHADTARGDMAKLVRLNIYMIAASMASSGVAQWYNPVWWFISLYNKIFLRITHGASRLQEIQADRLAASYFGIGNFKKGLEHIIRKTFEFKYLVDQEVKWAQSNQTGLRNLYSLTSIENFGPMEQEFRKALSQPTSPYDSHPSPMERFELIRNVPVRGSMMEDSRLIWDLIPGGPALQLEMTKTLEKVLQERGYLRPA